MQKSSKKKKWSLGRWVEKLPLLNYPLPIFQKLSLLQVARMLKEKLSQSALTTRASAISFNFFIALFPGIIFFFTLIPYIPIENFQATLMGILSGILPESAYQAAAQTLEDIITRQQGGLLSFGFVFALFFASNGFNSMMKAFNATKHTLDMRRPILRRWIALQLVIYISVLIIAAISLVIFTKWGVGYLLENKIVTQGITIVLLQILKWIILVGMCISAISVIYYLAPAGKHKYRFFSAGAAITTLLGILASIGFNFYIGNFAKYNVLYGSIGTLIIILMWIYFMSLILLAGFEINNAIISGKEKQKAISGK
ncbi:MAG: YihY/virulence factor BrkB family protein [Bacteroidetes bacterium]|nr:YihY/virulence factor BrkB family protein [Bacteroidota bacterium]MBU1720910.1 YihY/virulence factor BrkB family protein [Bacteroidota bacterium]